MGRRSNTLKTKFTLSILLLFCSIHYFYAQNILINCDKQIASVEVNNWHSLGSYIDLEDRLIKSVDLFLLFKDDTTDWIEINMNHV